MTKRAEKKRSRTIRTEMSDELFYCGRKRTKERSVDASWFLDRTIECGAATKKSFARAVQAPLSLIRELRWNRDYFLARLSLSGVPRCVLKKFRPAERSTYARVGAYRVINELVLIVPQVFSGARVRTFLDTAEQGLSRIVPHELFAVLYNDTHVRVTASAAPHAGERSPEGPAPQSVQERSARPDGRGTSERIARTEFPYYEWGNEHLRNMFMFTPMIRSRVPFSGIRTERMQEIVHGDNECVYMADRPDPTHFIGMVDMGALQESAVLCESQHGALEHGAPQVVNNYGGAPVSILYDEDVIQGATLRLKRLLNALASSGITDQVLVNCTCTPLIIGDDVRSVIKNVNSEKRTSFLYCDAVKQNASDIYLEYARSLVAGLKKYPPLPGTIALVGFPQVIGVSELIGLLTSLGITIQTAVLPRIGPSHCEGYYKAQLQVFFPNTDNMHIYEQVFFPVDRPRVLPDAPYGLERSRAWVNGILTRLAVSADAISRWELFCAEKEKEWAPLVQKARGYRVGMVVAPEDVDRLCDPASSVASLPLIPFLEEMGFRLDVCIYCPEGRYAELHKKVAGLFSAPEEHRITHCFGQRAVRTWLRDTSSVCVYSDLLRDPRLSKAGKTRFSVADFEMGFDGALRTIRRLLVKCRDPFYARYHDHFSATSAPVEFKEK